MEFEGGATAAFTMTAFNRQRDRKTRIFGTRGEIYGDGRIIEVYDFLTETDRAIDTETASDGSILGGHGGGDFGLMTLSSPRWRGDPARSSRARRVARDPPDGLCGRARAARRMGMMEVGRVDW